jgi:uncharacterized protein
MMRQTIKDLSERSEFIVVLTLSFAYVIASSLVVLLLRIREFELSTGRILRGIGVELAVLAVVGWILRVRGWRLRRLTSDFTWGACLAGIPLFVGYYVLYALASSIVVAAYPAAANLSTMRFNPTAPFLLMLFFIVVNSVFEETLVTGYVVTALSAQGASVAITASTLIRFLYHLYQGPVASLSVLPLGLLFGWVYLRSKTLWPLITAHTVANILSFAFAARHGA